LRMGLERRWSDPNPVALGVHLESRGLRIEQNAEGVVEPVLVPRMGEGQVPYVPMSSADVEASRAAWAAR
ncbi:MAG: hypothetical protein ACKOHN_03980, partial [Actinomycetota bacterium]